MNSLMIIICVCDIKYDDYLLTTLFDEFSPLTSIRRKERKNEFLREGKDKEERRRRSTNKQT